MRCWAGLEEVDRHASTERSLRVGLVGNVWVRSIKREEKVALPQREGKVDRELALEFVNFFQFRIHSRACQAIAGALRRVFKGKVYRTNKGCLAANTRAAAVATILAEDCPLVSSVAATFGNVPVVPLPSAGLGDLLEVALYGAAVEEAIARRIVARL